MASIETMRSASYLLPDPAGEVVRDLLDRITTLEAENDQLRACHEAELGVCEQHCDVVAALRAKVEQLNLRRCAICNDTRKLDNARAWDCGEEADDCPYCPDRVDTLRADLARERDRKEEAIAYGAIMEAERDNLQRRVERLEELISEHCKDCAGECSACNLALATPPADAGEEG